MPARSETLEGLSSEQSAVVRDVFSREDAAKFAQWTKDGSMAVDMVESLNLFSQDREKGTPRLLVLVDACANFYYRQKFGTDETLTTKQRKEFAGQVLHSLAEEKVGVAGGSVDNEEEVTEVMRKIFMEGFDDEGKLTSPGEVTTVLSGKIEELVKPWVEKDSPQAQVRTLAAQIQRIQASAGESEDRADNLEKRVKELGNLQELAEAQTTHIEELQRKLRIVEAGGGAWNEERRKVVETLFSSQPDKVRNQIAAALKKLDPINDKKVASQIEAPENLAETDKTLLEKFGKLEGLDLGKLVAAGISNEVMGSLAQILRLQLEQRRARQETTRQNNREKKEVKDYFATHEAKIEVNKKEGIIVDDAWLENLDRAAALGIEPLTKELLLPISTGLKDITDLEFRLEQSGRISQTVLASQKLTTSPDLDARKSRLTVLALDEVEKPFLLVRQFQEGQEVFTVEWINKKIGDVKFNEQGNLVISWEEMAAGEVLGASVGITNLCEEAWGRDRGLKGLKLTAAEPVERLTPEQQQAPVIEKPAEPPAKEILSAEAVAEEEQPPRAKETL